MLRALHNHHILNSLWHYEIGTIISILQLKKIWGLGKFKNLSKVKEQGLKSSFVPLQNYALSSIFISIIEMTAVKMYHSHLLQETEYLCVGPAGIHLKPIPGFIRISSTGQLWGFWALSAWPKISGNCPRCFLPNPLLSFSPSIVVLPAAWSESNPLFPPFSIFLVWIISFLCMLTDAN